MNRNEIEKRYYEAIKPDIDRLINNVTDLPLLDTLLDMDKQTREDLFTHVYGGCCKFPQICELARHLDYCFIDDGEMSLVYVKFKFNVDHYPKNDGYLELSTTFVIHGECYYYTDEELLELAMKYHSNHYKETAEIIEWVATPFFEEELQWVVDTLVHEHSGDTCDLDKAREWHKENDRFDEITKEYILSRSPKQERYEG